jgi:hypothetical protein
MFIISYEGTFVIQILYINYMVYNESIFKTDNKHLRNVSDMLHPFNSILTFSDPTSNLVRQYDFPVPLRCRKMSDTVFVAFVRPLLEPVWRFFSCSTDFSQQIAQVVLFLFLYVFFF